MTRREKSGRWRDLWWEVLVGILLVCGLVWVGWRAAQPGGGWILPAMSGRWALVGVAVAGGVAMVAQLYWPLRRSVEFWAAVVALAASLGATAYAWFPNGVSEGIARVVYFSLPSSAEFAVFACLVYRKFHLLPGAKG